MKYFIQFEEAQSIGGKVVTERLCVYKKIYSAYNNTYRLQTIYRLPVWRIHGSKYKYSKKYYSI